MRLFRCAVLLATLSLCVQGAMANPITYTYQGNPFTITSGGFPTAGLSGSITLSSALAAGTMTDAISSGLLTAWSLSNGNTSFNAGNSTAQTAQFWTDASGNITQWMVTFSIPDPNNPNNFNQVLAVWQSLNNPQSGNPPFPTDFGSTLCCPSTFDGVNVNNPGTWTAGGGTVVPEPASVALFGTGLVGLAGLIRRKRRP